MSNHNIAQENKQSRLMDTVDRIDARFPNLGETAKKIGGGTLALGILIGGGAIYNEVGPRTSVGTEVADIHTSDFGQTRNLVLNKTEKLAEEYGVNLDDITGVTDTTSSLLNEHKLPLHANVELSKKPFVGYAISAETANRDPANIPSLPDQQNK